MFQGCVMKGIWSCRKRCQHGDHIANIGSELKFVGKHKDIGWLHLNKDVMLTHHPSQMVWASAKPADIAAFGLKERLDMDRDLEDQQSEYKIWIMNEDFYACIDEFQKCHPNGNIDFIYKE